MLSETIPATLPIGSGNHRVLAQIFPNQCDSGGSTPGLSSFRNRERSSSMQSTTQPEFCTPGADGVVAHSQQFYAQAIIARSTPADEQSSRSQIALSRTSVSYSPKHQQDRDHPPKATSYRVTIPSRHSIPVSTFASRSTK